MTDFGSDQDDAPLFLAVLAVTFGSSKNACTVTVISEKAHA